MSHALAALVEILDLERIEQNVFRGKQANERRVRVFGGLVAGQALVAAGRTVADARPVHSLHAYFLRAGDPGLPILYQVERTRDGRTFSTRRVTAIQNDRAIFTLSASFHAGEAGFEHQRPMPTVPPPEAIEEWETQMRRTLAGRFPGETRHREWVDRERPIERRPVELMDYFGGRQEPHAEIWIRAKGRLPDDPLLHRCVVAYASDMTLLDTAARPHPIDMLADDAENASLDHALWFHRDFRADDWLLYAQESPIMAGARGLTTGHFFTRDGTLVASVVQEGLFRKRRRS